MLYHNKVQEDQILPPNRRSGLYTVARGWPTARPLATVEQSVDRCTPVAGTKMRR